MAVPFISVEGPIGVGKTSLAKAICEHFNYDLLLEIVEENPFLEQFYQNIDEWSFQTEMFFLCNRYKQLQDINKHFLSKELPVVSDYHIFKNTIFAARTLKPIEWTKYKQIYDILTEDMPKPNLVIFLNASLETLLQRIDKRGRNVEKNIDHTYLLQLSEDYKHYITLFRKQNPNIPVISLDGDKLDFVNNPQDLSSILSEVEHIVKKELDISYV